MGRIPKSYTGGGPEQGFRCCFEDGLNQGYVSSVAHARNDEKAIFFTSLIKGNCHHLI